jgi:hypothetical protein
LDTKYANAKKALTTIQYTGTSRQFPISMYLKSLQTIFNDFADCDKPYTEFEKVLAFTDGLLVKDLNAIKLDILKEPYKNDYEAAIGHFKFMLNHNIVDISDGSAGPNRDRGVSTVGSMDSKSDWLPTEEWNKLSKEEKNKRSAARAKAKSKKDGDKSAAAVSTKAQKRRAKKKRTMAKLAKDVIQAAEEMVESEAKRQKVANGSAVQQTTSPADQFGRNSSAVKLARMFANQNLNDSD